MRSFSARFLIVAAIVAAVALGAWRSSRPKTVPVVFGVVDRGRVERTVANTRAGTVQACRRARLAPPMGGQIVALPVREGTRVHAGDVLLELWSQNGVAQQRQKRISSIGGVTCDIYSAPVSSLRGVFPWPSRRHRAIGSRQMRKSRRR